MYAIICLETYEPVLLEQKAKRLRQETGNPALYTNSQSQLLVGVALQREIIRPAKMLLLCLIITSLSLYISVVYSFTYLLFSTFSVVFKDQYHYRGGGLELAYLGLAGDMLLSLSITSIVCDRNFVRLSKKHGKE